jgi:hypothetical protein
MEIWLNWLIGFIIWFFCILLLAIITYFIAGAQSNYSLQGKIPNEAFDYSDHPDFIPKDAILLDTHSHTIASDGWMTPEQNIRWHIANGYQAFVLTDHNTDKNNKPSVELQEKYPEILIIPGYEWTANRIHLNFLGIEEFPDKVPSNPTDEEIKNAIKKAHELGAVVQIDHITWTLDRPLLQSGDLVHPTREQLLEWDVDGFEINNEMRWYDPKTVHWIENLKRDGNQKIANKFISTGTDIHNPIKEWATGWTELILTVEEKSKAQERLTWEMVKQVLLEGRTKIWVDHDYKASYESKIVGGSEKSYNISKINFFAPFFGLAVGIGKVPGTPKGIISYVLWFLAAYFPLRLLFTWLISI